MGDVDGMKHSMYGVGRKSLVGEYWKIYIHVHTKLNHVFGACILYRFIVLKLSLVDFTQMLFAASSISL